MGAQTQSHSSAFVVNFNGAQQSKLSVLQASRTQSSQSFVSALRPAPVASVPGSLIFQQRQGTAGMNIADASQQKQNSQTSSGKFTQKPDQTFVLDSDFANLTVGTTIDEIFSEGRDIQAVQVQEDTPAPVAKQGFRGLIERVFNSPNYTMVGDDIYARDLVSEMQYTPVASPSSKRVKATNGTLEKWSDTYESKVNLEAGAFERVDPAQFVSPANLTSFGRSAGVRATKAPYKSVIMMSQAIHESH